MCMLAVANCYLMAIPRSEFQPGFSAGLFFFIKSQSQHARHRHHAIFRASAFIACLPSTQLPMGDPQFLPDMTVSLGGSTGTGTAGTGIGSTAGVGVVVCRGPLGACGRARPSAVLRVLQKGFAFQHTA